MLVIPNCMVKPTDAMANMAAEIRPKPIDEMTTDTYRPRTQRTLSDVGRLKADIDPLHRRRGLRVDELREEAGDLADARNEQYATHDAQVVGITADDEGGEIHEGLRVQPRSRA
jgi:hypothetical protein